MWSSYNNTSKLTNLVKDLNCFLPVYSPLCKFVWCQPSCRPGFIARFMLIQPLQCRQQKYGMQKIWELSKLQCKKLVSLSQNFTNLVCWKMPQSADHVHNQKYVLKSAKFWLQINYLVEVWTDVVMLILCQEQTCSCVLKNFS